MDPIVAAAGQANRDDGKDLISLAVSFDYACIFELSNLILSHSSAYAH